MKAEKKVEWDKIKRGQTWREGTKHGGVAKRGRTQIRPGGVVKRG